MAATMAQILEAGRQRAGLSNRNLWIGYCSLGGTADPGTLADYLRGVNVPGHAEYDLIAQTINDTFVEMGSDHPLPYAEDLLHG